MQKIDNKLLEKFHSGNCTPEEEAIIDYYLHYDEIPIDISGMEAELEDFQMPVNLVAEKTKPINRPLRLAAVAATIAVILGIGVWVFNSTEKPVETYANDIKPGTNKAILTLPNGTTIDLDTAKNGQLSADQGINIIKQEDGQLLYQFSSSAVKASASGKLDSISELVGIGAKRGTGLERLNTLSTPRGGQYHIALPDGTNVWLNAGSILKFPSTFEGLAERRVLLIGEAYFEVTQVKTLFGMKKRAAKQPFIVKTAAQEVKVLGTHFNINAYPDEKETKTTLLEGSVGITAPLLQAEQTILKPDDQAVNNGSEIKVKKVDTDEAVAWKNGYFQFDETGIEAVMKQFSRWYNVEVFYQGGVPEGKFYGQLPRKITLQKALDILKLTDINYKIQGRKLIIKND